ncbi:MULTISPECIES: AMP-binding protein [Mycobacterium]|uniref:Acyl-CoA synthetase n=1 Tax=Mycobacterium gordonae TaxID=1778 RepID=A0A1A6BI49_MYCGO|nr:MULTISPECIES: AMP-binding protein [Mycobacterium]MCQ4359964.1 long-chain fatty acid--CoA ligase [Mycobacterium gordonae]MCV7005197.1 long-chain fatty acid--CoA ligase [Mycobacterium gordonae]OBS02032.1 AMP-dependent synthetase [Mycobacterium gordonae]ODR21502.1 AMP-dependent synthetase [Mycobacterium gordonae]ORV94348.1 AMP-dependent synthetase [Mycobacterium gordonae]
MTSLDTSHQSHGRHTAKEPTASSDPRTLCAAFQRTATVDPDAVALRTPGDSVSITWRQYATRVQAIAAGLARLGVGHGDTVALLMSNRPEFHLVDTAAIHLGAVPFSMYNTSSPEQIQYLLNHSGARVVVCDADHAQRLDGSRADIEHLVCVDADFDGIITLAVLEATPLSGFDFEATWQTVQPSDLLTLIYTSGTTGAPKGVELTHSNLLAQSAACQEIFDLRFGDRITSYLPSAHIADRLSCHYGQLTHGTQITCVSDARAIIGALPEVQPTVWVAVPRIWEKLKLAIEMGLHAQSDPETVQLAQWALGVGLAKVRAEQTGQRVPTELVDDYRRADQQVFAALRRQYGFDQMRWAMSGAAALAPSVLEFFLALGVRVCEIWGMSETVGAATANPPERVKVGTVGRPLPGIELRIADDGEALLRGPIVMRGYRGDPARTAEVLNDDGWLATGDVVSQDDDGYVTIIDRKKELIINAAGKNMSPSNIELAISAACPLIGGIMVVGDGRPYNVALIVLDPLVCAAFAAKSGIADNSPAALASHPAISAMIDAGVQAGNATLSRVEQIKRYRVLPDIWDPGGPQFTPTMKMRRRAIAEQYSAEIEELYNSNAEEPQK